MNGIAWIKDGNPLFEDGVRIKLTSRILLTIVSVQREDSGMYQCFVYNDVESAQGTAQLLLGGTFYFKLLRFFIEFLSLKFFFVYLKMLKFLVLSP